MDGCHTRRHTWQQASALVQCRTAEWGMLECRLDACVITLLQTPADERIANWPCLPRCSLVTDSSSSGRYAWLPAAVPGRHICSYLTQPCGFAHCHVAHIQHRVGAREVHIQEPRCCVCRAVPFNMLLTNKQPHPQHSLRSERVAVITRLTQLSLIQPQVQCA
jgi:hypothetical protein